MKRPLFVLVAGGRWDGVRFGVHSIAEGLLRHGRVLFVDPPTGLHAARRPLGWRSRPDEVGPDLFVLRPVVPPGHSRPGGRLAAAAVLRRAIQAATRRLGGPVDAVIAFSPQFPVFGACDERRRVYYAKDDVASGAALMGLDEQRLLTLEQRRAAQADVVVAASEEIARRWELRGVETTLIPNGVDYDRFAGARLLPRPADVELPAPVAGFIGHLSARIDFSLLAAVADTGVSVLLVGPRQQTLADTRLGPLLARPNVAWVGAVPYEELPAYVGAMDVGLVPYTNSAFNRASFPLKILQHLAAGAALCTTDLPSVRWLGTDLIDVADDPSSFAEAVQARASRSPEPPEILARQALARRHDWSRRVEQLLDVL